MIRILAREGQWGEGMGKMELRCGACGHERYGIFPLVVCFQCRACGRFMTSEGTIPADRAVLYRPLIQKF